MTTLNAAPSAAPAGTPALTVPTSAPAPSAVAPTIPNPVLNLADYDALAAASITANNTPPADPVTLPVPAPGHEPALVPPAPAAVIPHPIDPTAPAPVQIPGTEPDDVPDPTPEELSVLNDAGQRALKAERDERKAARKEVRELKAKLAELQKQPAPKPPQPVIPDPAAAVPPVVATPSVPTPALADCQTFEAAEARGLAASQTEIQALTLQTQLQRQGAEAVSAQLAQLGIQKIGETPVAEASPEVLADFLGTVIAGAKMTQAQVAPRKRFIATQNASWQAAVQVLPEMDDVKSPVHQQIAAFVRANPNVKAMANWPLVCAKLFLGEKAFNTQAQPAPAKTAPAVIKPAPATMPAPVARTLHAAPGAPSSSAAAVPQSNRLAELSSKLTNGTATLADVDEYGRLSMGG